MGDLDGARRSHETVAEPWLHRAEVWRLLARIEQLRGRRDEARLARRRAAALDASDLATLRLVALDAGGEIFGWAARDCAQAIHDCLSSGIHSTMHAVQVLDLAASEWQPDGSVLARGRGNRLVPLLAALEACRVPAHLVAARSFAANPHPFRFPHPEVHATWLVRADPGGGPEVWIYPAARDVPVGVLEPSLSEADAFVVPRPGEVALRVRLPAVDPWEHSAADRYELELAADGAMRGTLARTAHGAAAGWFRRLLEETAPDSLRKAEEQRLAAVFRGVAVSEAAPALDDDRSHASMRGAFAVPSSGVDVRREWPASPSADRLAHRLLSRGERRMPLVIGDDEAAASTTHVRLPPGTKARLPQDVALDTPFGRYSLRWREGGDGLVGVESLLVRHQRVAPERYADFARLVAAVDQARAATTAVGAAP